MSLRNRPRARWLMQLPRRAWDWHEGLIEGGLREREKAAAAFTAPLDDLLVQVRRRREESQLMAEQWIELDQALAECRRGNLGRWAFILYERTLDPKWCKLKADGALPRYMIYGVLPEFIGSSREEIEEFHRSYLAEEQARGAQTI